MRKAESGKFAKHWQRRRRELHIRKELPAALPRCMPRETRKGARMPQIPVPAMTIGLLLASNVFMTFAWYGHLKYKAAPLAAVILVSWGIAFFEYVLMVPANRIGHGHFSAAQLKTIQEVITLSVFVLFSWLYLKEPVTLKTMIGFGFIGIGAWFIFTK